jgi:DMSO/TMAO reductase YedYZ heme-binding membrane subunit
MKRHVKPTFWVECALASFSVFLVVLTAVWHDWIEGIFGFDPDHHNGSFEWELVVVCCALAVLFATLARREWRMTATARGTHR